MMRWLKRFSLTPASFHPTLIAVGVVASLVVALFVAIPAVYEGTKSAPPPPLPRDMSEHARTSPDANPPRTAAAPGRASGEAFTPPSADTIPQGQFGDMVKLGRNIFVDTQTYAKGYVGNGLNCVNCHLDEGRKAHSAPLWAAYVKFPAYREKNQKVNSYEDRLAGCFRFSMNGKPPPYESKEMLALVTYSYWLAQGAPTGAELAGRGYPKLDKPPLPPDATRGQAVFSANCAICHRADGQGTQVDGRYAFPPLWGKDSYNKGAGMFRVDTAAAFIRANMPLGKPGTLTVQEAWDVAQYIDSQDRPPDPRQQANASVGENPAKAL